MTEKKGNKGQFAVGHKRGGRPAGVPNKNTTALKDAILEAGAKAGGKEGLVGYLTKLAIKNPPAFSGLLGKVLPMQVTGENGGPVVIGWSDDGTTFDPKHHG